MKPPSWPCAGSQVLAVKVALRAVGAAEAVRLQPRELERAMPFVRAARRAARVGVRAQLDDLLDLGQKLLEQVPAVAVGDGGVLQRAHGLSGGPARGIQAGRALLAALARPDADVDHRRDPPEVGEVVGHDLHPAVQEVADRRPVTVVPDHQRRARNLVDPVVHVDPVAGRRAGVDPARHLALLRGSRVSHQAARGSAP